MSAYPLTTIFILVNVTMLAPVGVVSGIILALLGWRIIQPNFNFEHLLPFLVFLILVCLYALLGAYNNTNWSKLVESIFDALNAPLVLLLVLLKYQGKELSFYKRDISFMFLSGFLLALLSLVHYFLTHFNNFDLLSTFNNVNWQSFTFRMVGLHWNPNNFSFMLYPSLCAFVIYLNYNAQKLRDYFFAFTICLCVLLSGSRGTIGGMMVLILLCAFVPLFRLSSVFPILIAVSTSVVLLIFLNLGPVFDVLTRLSISSIDDLLADQLRGEIFLHNLQLSDHMPMAWLIGIGLPGYFGDAPTDNSFARLFFVGGAVLLVIFGLAAVTFLGFLASSKIAFAIAISTLAICFTNDWFFVKAFGLILSLCILERRFSLNKSGQSIRSVV